MLYLLFVFSIFLMLCTYLMCKRDILAPSVLAIIMYTISIGFALINIKSWGIVYSLKTFFVMVVGLTAFALPCIFFNKNKKNRPIKSTPIRVDKKILLIFLFIDIIITFFYIKEVYAISLIGGNNLGLFGMAYYYRTYTAVNSDAESLSTLMNQLLKLGRAMGFCSIFILSYNLQFKDIDKKNNKYLAFIVFLTALQNLIGGGRGYILWMIGTSFSVIYFSDMKNNNWQKPISFKYIKKGLLILCFSLTGFYFLKYLIRLGNSVNSIIDYISYYIGGSIQNFNLYIQNPPVNTKMIIGQETFTGLYSTLQKFGIVDVSNVYLTNTNLEFRTSNGMTIGNVYGAIRRYYNDFGIIGVFLLQFICSLFYNIFYSKLKRINNEKKFRWQMFFYSYLLYHIYEIAIDDCFFKNYISFNMFTSFLVLYIVYWIMVHVHIEDYKIKIDRWVENK